MMTSKRVQEFYKRIKFIFSAILIVNFCYGQDNQVKYPPKVTFDASYKYAHRNRIYIEVPEIHELIYVMIALTKTGINEERLLYKNSSYYKSVITYFSPYMNDPSVIQFDSLVSKQGTYQLTFNAYSFDYDRKRKIVASKVYDRITYSDNQPNNLRPFIKIVQSFSDSTNFRKFYSQNTKLYNSQKKYFQDTVNVQIAISWLEKNFPNVKYNSHKIIFSPLAGYIQGMAWFENNGFKELQAHVNFTYTRNVKFNIKSQELIRSSILFTEINHGYINKEALKYENQINSALTLLKRDKLIDKFKDKDFYGSPMETFNEYMNWGLVSLRYADFSDKQEVNSLLALNERYMLKRGFSQFKEFNSFLVDLYKHRKKDQTIANLYPEIITWFSKI